MNQVRQQEKLREIHKLGFLDTPFFHAALHAPLFEWDSWDEVRMLTPDEIEFVQTKILTGPTNAPTVAPFDCFRISMRDHFDLWFRYPELQVWALLRVIYATQEHPEQWFANNYSWSTEGQTAYSVWQNGVCCTANLNDASGKVRPEARRIMQDCLHLLTYFLFQIMQPANTVMKVSPPQRPGKSVEWHLARTHYLVLNRKQAQACQQRKSGMTDREVARAAHWRRAHFRRLHSEKFKRKGEIVPVRHAWVGPTEWQGLDGKIYKVLESPSEAAAQNGKTGK